MKVRVDGEGGQNTERLKMIVLEDLRTNKIPEQYVWKNVRILPSLFLDHPVGTYNGINKNRFLRRWSAARSRATFRCNPNPASFFRRVVLVRKLARHV